MSGFVADSEGHTTSGPTITWGEYDCLLARLRYLDAKNIALAIRDAEYRSAIEDYLEAERVMADIRQADLVRGERYVYHEERTQARERLKATIEGLAALAAREEEE